MFGMIPLLNFGLRLRQPENVKKKRDRKMIILRNKLFVGLDDGFEGKKGKNKTKSKN